MRLESILLLRMRVCVSVPVCLRLRVGVHTCGPVSTTHRDSSTHCKMMTIINLAYTLLHRI